jgi:hypothetical protein
VQIKKNQNSDVKVSLPNVWQKVTEKWWMRKRKKEIYEKKKKNMSMCKNKMNSPIL